MHWRKAMEAAAGIAGRWTAEGGPGGAILLFDGSDIRAEACGGLASLELALPFTAGTAVRYASISKHFCAALLVRLASEGWLSLDDALGAYLPKLAPAQAGVTIARALDMTGGLPDALEAIWLLGVPWSASLDRASLLRFAAGADALNFPPGSEVSYSNTGYRLVEAALAGLDIPFGETLHARFFRPLGLSIRLPEDESEPVTDLAAGYYRTSSGWRRGRYGLHFSPSGGLAGSASDLVAWLQALMTRRAPAADLLAPLGARRHLSDGRATGYGLGLARSPLDGEIAIGHGGSLPGYKNHFLLLPGRGAGVAVLSNREDTDAHGIALTVLAALTGAPAPEPASGLLPQGLFVADGDPFWIEHEGGELSFLGATETLIRGEDGTAVSRSSALPVSLRFAGDAIEGEIGHVARRFRPVPADAEVSADFVGTWVCTGQNGRFAITPGGFLATGAGPLHATLPLMPLGERSVLADHTEGPRRQRACLVLETNNTLRVVTSRCRMLRFTRA